MSNIIEKPVYYHPTLHTYTHVFENDEYEAWISFSTNPDTGKEDYDLSDASRIKSKKSGVETYGLKVQKIEITNNLDFFFRIGYSPFEAVKFYSVNEHSDQEFWKLKQFAYELDELIRERFPGYSLVWREDDPPHDSDYFNNVLMPKVDRLIASL